jgi:TPR repeat protein
MNLKAKYLVGIVCTLMLIVNGQAMAGIADGQAAILKGQFSKAFKEFRKDAVKGDPRAMEAVAVMLHMGEGVKQDLKKALSWYRKAAEKGDAAGMANVGIMYYKGAGTIQSDVQAYAWLDVASYMQGGKEHNVKARVASFLSSSQLKEAKALAKQYRQMYAKK